jgi:hypothetical protein
MTMLLTLDEIDKRFNTHKPDKAKGLAHNNVRLLVRSLARELNTLLPDGREASLVFTHLEEVMFWANASIARQDNDE